MKGGERERGKGRAGERRKEKNRLSQNSNHDQKALVTWIYLTCPWPNELRFKLINAVESSNKSTASLLRKKVAAKGPCYISHWLEHYDHDKAYISFGVNNDGD